MQSTDDMIATDPLSPAMMDLLRRFVARSRRLRMLHASGAALAFVLIWILCWSLVDRILPMPGWVRFILLLTVATAALMVLVRPIYRLIRADIPWHRAAAALEERDPQFGGRLQTALSQLLMPAAQRGSAAMLAQVIEETAVKASSVDLKALLPAAPALRPATIAATALAMMLVMLTSSWLDLPRLLKRQLMPFSNAAPVTITRLFVRRDR